MAAKFPQLIHVTRETPEHGAPYLEVQHGGVTDIETPGQTVAIYQLVTVGHVKIVKSFIDPRRKAPAKRRA